MQRAAAFLPSMLLAAGAEHDLRLATTAPSGTDWVTAAETFAARAATLSGGRLRIEVFANSELGDGETAARQVARGRIDLAMLANSDAGLLVPE